MDPTRFDDLARSLVQPASRRGAFGLVVGGALTLLETSTGTAKRRHRRGKKTQAAAGGNSSCAQFCAKVFGDNSSATGQCASDGAHGKGLCATCGTASPSTICCPRNRAGFCTNYATALCPCSGTTPTCTAGGACVCSGTSCGTGSVCCSDQCVRGDCCSDGDCDASQCQTCQSRTCTGCTTPNTMCVASQCMACGACGLPCCPGDGCSQGQCLDDGGVLTCRCATCEPECLCGRPGEPTPDCARCCSGTCRPNTRTCA